MADISPVLFEALKTEAAALKCIDDDILLVHSDLTSGLTVDDNGKPDPAAIKEAVRAIKSRSPRLFKENDWRVLAADPDQRAYLAQEKAFRESIRTSHRVGPNPFKTLDTALLSPIELESLNRHLGGRGDSYDRSLLQRALRAQNGDKDAA